MKYVDQIVRPRSEYGCDYGYARRSVLVRSGDRDLLHIAGHSGRAGIGMREYWPAEIALWRPDVSIMQRQKTIHTGRITRTDWELLAPQIYAHLGTEFSLDLIDRTRTLLLDQPGEVEPPAYTRKPPAEQPRVGPRLYRIYDDQMGDDVRLVEFDVVAQRRNRVTVRRTGVTIERDVRLDQLKDRGYGETSDEALELYLNTYREKLKAVAAALLRATTSYAAAEGDLAAAQERLNTMKEETRA
jgi:hypothetical protein